jgi:hypothetical protein
MTSAHRVRPFALAASFQNSWLSGQTLPIIPVMRIVPPRINIARRLKIVQKTAAFFVTSPCTLPNNIAELRETRCIAAAQRRLFCCY